MSMILIEAYCKQCKLHYDINIIVCHFCNKETEPIKKQGFKKVYKVKFVEQPKG